MESLLRALGFESKPDYIEKIPESLESSDFKVQDTFHHGFPSQPTCLEYDVVQQLLAIGTESGAILLMGKPGLERYFKHPTQKAILKMQFIINKGLLVTCCDDGLLHLWSIKEQCPKIIHTLEFTRENEKPTCLSHSYMSEWLYVGSEGGNVYVIHIPSFVISGFTVYWDKSLGSSARSRPGRVLDIIEHPMDQGKILIAYIKGYCVLYNMKHHESSAQESKQPPDHKRFSFNPGDNHIMTSVSWVNCGRCFACSYSDGSIVLWNSKSEAKPEKMFFMHDFPQSQFRPIYKMEVMLTDGDPLYVCSGGFPENDEDAPKTLTLLHGKSSTMVSSSSTIIDFICLPSSPHVCDYQKLFALVILAKNEMIILDLNTPGYPRYPSYSLPYALDIHLPTVTFIYYSAACPEEFIAQLHSVKSKMMTPSTKPWPLNGGKWGQEVPHSTTDIIATGHTDGSVRLWHCNSVIFQPFFTVDTSRYFKMLRDETPTKEPTPVKNKMRPPPPSHPPPQSKRASEKNLMKVKTPSPEASKDVGGPDTDEAVVATKQQDMKVMPSPATGQVHPMDNFANQENTDGSESGPPPVERRSIFYKDKSGKKKRKSKLVLDASASLPEDPENEGESSAMPGDKKYSSILSGKSLYKLAKVVKQRDKKQKKDEEGEEDVDTEGGGGGGGGEEGTSEKSSTSPPANKSPLLSSESEQKYPKKRPPPRPKDIVLKKSTSNCSTPKLTFTTTTDDTFSLDDRLRENTSSQQHNKKKSLQKLESPPKRTQNDVHPYKLRESPHRLTTRAQVCQIHSEVEDEFFYINYIQMCMCGFWLCVANDGGSVMTFDFTLTPRSQPAGNVDINFDYDSIKKKYRPSPSIPSGQDDGGTTMTSSSRSWVYDAMVSDSSTGYQLTQMCQCFFTVSSGGERGVQSPQTNPEMTAAEKKPVAVSHIQYSKDIRLLAIATRRGFAIVDTQNNSCLYVLSSSTSILYLADPSKFTTQMRRESKLNLVARPSIKRYGTSVRFSEEIRPKVTSSNVKLKYASVSDIDSQERMERTCEVSVELESCVSSLELVQIQLDKLSRPMLTLWVGLASGYIVAYSVNMLNGSGSGKRFELIPTRLITETKHPVVKILFLNEWGDCQVVPYKPNRDMSPHGGDHEELVHAHQQSSNPNLLASNAPRHYGIFVDEIRIRSFSFPGYNKINTITLPVGNDKVILRSDYFTSSDLPCLATIASCQKLFIHTLPGLKLMMSIPFGSLSDPRAMGTFRISGNGQGLYMSSPSEIQRISIVKENMLNYPDCLPSVFSERRDVPTSSYGRGFLGGLFSGSPATVNREEMFGEAAAVTPIGNICTVDGETCLAYGSKRRRRKPASLMKDDSVFVGRESPVTSNRGAGASRRGGGGMGKTQGGSSSKEGGLSGQMNKNRQALDERSRKLGEAVEATERMAANASSYSDLARQLAMKYERK